MVQHLKKGKEIQVSKIVFLDSRCVIYWHPFAVQGAVFSQVFHLVDSTGSQTEN